MLDDESSTAPEARRAPASVHPVRRAVLLAAAACVALAWSATLEVVCAAAGGGAGGSVVATPPCPAQGVRAGAALASAGVVALGLALLLVARRQAWASRPGAERLLFATYAVVTCAAVVAAFFSTGFSPTI